MTRTVCERAQAGLVMRCSYILCPRADFLKIIESLDEIRSIQVMSQYIRSASVSIFHAREIVFLINIVYKT